MFLQFKGQPHQRDLLRFLWWDEGDTTRRPSHFRMTRHLFGAVSSMGCANVGLKGIADDYEHMYGKDAADFIRDCFYVDDGLCSVSSEEHAADLIKRSILMCKEGGIELAKFVSSSSKVLKSLDPSLIAAKIKVDLSETVNERSLGVHWHVNDDNFFYSVQQPQEIYTRRKVLSTIASVFDPMGLVSPFVLLGKQILQEACYAGLDWDDELPDPLKHRYKEWCAQLQDLSSITIQRCIKPPDFNVSSVEFHHFADASSSGYGVCSYIRLVDHNGSVSVSLVFAKSRVTPIKPVTIPRLELTAAVLAVRCSVLLEREFKFECPVKHFFYSDSTVVLGYISNSTRRYQVLVANRVGVIQSLASVSQ